MKETPKRTRASTHQALDSPAHLPSEAPRHAREATISHGTMAKSHRFFVFRPNCAVLPADPKLACDCSRPDCFRAGLVRWTGRGEHTSHTPTQGRAVGTEARPKAKQEEEEEEEGEEKKAKNASRVNLLATRTSRQNRTC
jgi:hypothetical protein